MSGLSQWLLVVAIVVVGGLLVFDGARMFLSRRPQLRTVQRSALFTTLCTLPACVSMIGLGLARVHEGGVKGWIGLGIALVFIVLTLLAWTGWVGFSIHGLKNEQRDEVLRAAMRRTGMKYRAGKRGYSVPDLQLELQVMNGFYGSGTVRLKGPDRRTHSRRLLMEGQAWLEEQKLEALRFFSLISIAAGVLLLSTLLLYTL